MSKFIFLEHTLSPRFKNGIDQAGATLVSGLTGAGSSLFGGLFGLDSADDALSANVRENAKNRQFNAEQAELNRQFQHKERLQSQSWQAQQWYSQFMDQSREWTRQQDYANEQSYEYWLKQQQYNSPSEMVRRAQLAGLNPASMLGQNYGSTGLSAAPTSVPSSGGLPTSVPAGSAASVGLSNPSAATSKADSIASLFQGVASLTSAVAGSTKDNALAEQIKQLTPHLVDGAIKSNVNKELLNEWQKVENTWQPLFKDKELGQIEENMKKLIYESVLLGREADTEEVRKQLVYWQAKTESKNSDIVAAQADNILTAIELENNLKAAQRATEETKQQANRAAASESIAHANLYGQQSRAQEITNQFLPEQLQKQLANLDAETQEKIIRKQLAGIELSLKKLNLSAAEIENLRKQDVITLRRDGWGFRTFDNVVSYVMSQFGLALGGIGAAAIK